MNMTKQEYLTWLALWGEAKELQTQGAWAITSNGRSVLPNDSRACKFCASGALRQGPDLYGLPAIIALTKKVQNIQWWNDYLSTFAERRSVFRELVAELEAAL